MRPKMGINFSLSFFICSTLENFRIEYLRMSHEYIVLNEAEIKDETVVKKDPLLIAKNLQSLMLKYITILFFSYISRDLEKSILLLDSKDLT